MSESPLPVLVPDVITPAEAKRVLGLAELFGCRSDPVDMDHVRSLARDMVCGDWQDANPVPLGLCSHGAVVRGVHRLHAVVISQKPRRFLIARDVPHHVHDLPRAKARTAADALGTVGVDSHRKDIAAAVRLLHLFDSARATLPWPDWRSRTFTNAETTRLFQTRYPDLPQAVPVMTAVRSGLSSLPPATLAAAYLVTRASSGAAPAASDFLQGLVLPSALELADPRRALHRWFTTPGRPARGMLAATHQLGLFLTCWNAWAAQTHWDKAVFGPAERMPDLCSVSP